VTVCHTPGKRVWARDDDGDDIREVHVNTVKVLDRITQLPSPFRGVNKVYLQQYVAIHEWATTLKMYYGISESFMWCHTIRLMSRFLYRLPGIRYCDYLLTLGRAGTFCSALTSCLRQARHLF